uniref:Putative ser/thr protein n=1 Tax=Ixodes ricinus TaxID=34613 RepID=A0A090X8Z6_IXORI
MGAMMSLPVSIVRILLQPCRSGTSFWAALPGTDAQNAKSAEFVASFKQVLIIGDVHGCYDELMELLHTHRAHDKDTLKLFVGDLVNKGSQERASPRLHHGQQHHLPRVCGATDDEAVLREYLASRDPDYQLYPENSWIGRLSDQHAHFLQELPYTLGLPSLNALVVHAGLVPGQGLATSPRNMVSMRNLLVRDPSGAGGHSRCQQ